MRQPAGEQHEQRTATSSVVTGRDRALRLAEAADHEQRGDDRAADEHDDEPEPEPEHERSERRDDRAQRGEQDDQDDREREQLRGREPALRDLL